MMRWTQEQLESYKNKTIKVSISKPNKYRNRKVVYNDIVFDSQHEAEVYSELLLRQYAKEIYALDRQISFDLKVNDQLVCRYISDFTYYTHDDVFTIVDAKSEFTKKLPEYRIKKKLLKACLGLDIIEL